MSVSPFVDVKYSADRDFVKHYHTQAAYVLGKKYNKDPEELLPLVREVFIPNKNGFKEARFKVLEKNKAGDRVIKVKSAREFFAEVEENNYHLSPSLVAYKHSDEEQSVNAIGTEKFLKLRSYNKGLRQVAIAAGDDEKAKAYNEIQNALKIFNNAQSGAMSSNGTPLNNKSGHTSLTSTCRTLTSTANILNERLLNGNRLFINFERTIENFVSQIVTTDLKQMEAVIQKYKMEYATVEQVMAMIRHCTAYYWKNDNRFNMLHEFVKTMTPVERTCILCSQDLKGMYTTNPVLITEFLEDWIKIPEVPADAKIEDYPKPNNGDYYVLAVSKLARADDVAMRHLNAYHLTVEDKWKDFIQVFFKAKCTPTGVFSIKEMIRESVLTSDTDSSIYTVDKLIERFGATDEVTANSLNAVLTYFVRMLAVHQHAQFSKNMNVADRHLDRLTMKNEFKFGVGAGGGYVTTNLSKHYYSLQAMCEGVVYPKPKMEIKGAHLRSSKIAQKIRDFAHTLMRTVLDASGTNTKLDASELLFQVAEIEREVMKDIMEDCSCQWLARSTIKNEDVYTNPDSSIFVYHDLWQEVFAIKYGDAPPLPYSAMKLNTLMDSKSKLKEYIEAIPDESIAKRFAAFIERKGKSDLSSFYIPSELIQKIGGFPKEMIPGVDVRSIIAQNLKSVYVVLESLGIYCLNKKITRLISDEH